MEKLAPATRFRSPPWRRGHLTEYGTGSRHTNDACCLQIPCALLLSCPLWMLPWILIESEKSVSRLILELVQQANHT